MGIETFAEFILSEAQASRWQCITGKVTLY